MGQKKLIRFAEIETFQNVLQYPQHMKGQWSTFFKNDHLLTLELACGKGEYAVGLGRMHPQRNFIGIDLKGNRIWVGAKTAIKENLGNVAFVRSQIDQVNNYFAADEVNEIWITFPDPQPQQGRERKRLTSPEFIARYEKFCKTGALIHFKTDNRFLFDYTIEVLRDLGKKVIRKEFHVHRDFPNDSLFNILTHYEGIYLKAGKPIHYLCFEL
jgi:tRNA (guanine-N7-)-methyltransferase